MESPILCREVIGHFYKDSSKRVHLNALTVLQETKGYEGRVYVSRQEWDVDYSRKFGYIFHMSGCGGGEEVEVSGIYHRTTTCVAKRLLGEPVEALTAPRIVEKEPQWVDSRDEPPFDNRPRTKAIRERNRTRQIFRLPKVFDKTPEADLMDWLNDNGIESDSVWCSSCRDCFPGNDDWNLCEHCWWCDKTGTYSTPSERCDCKSREECRGDA